MDLIIEFRTESGSLYAINISKMTWSRESAKGSGVIRHENGDLLSLPLIKVGQRVAIHDSKTLAFHSHHFVYTTPVVWMTPGISIEEIQDETIVTEEA